MPFFSIVDIFVKNILKKIEIYGIIIMYLKKYYRKWYP